MNILNGKKIIFIGNSFTYYGKTVIFKDYSVLDQESRNNDNGYFYQLCKLNGADVSVTNWTFGAHALRDTFGSCCEAKKPCAGVNHFSYLKDKFYDYVAIQESSRGIGDRIVDDVKGIMEIFRKENPNVKFIYLVHENYHTKNRTEILEKTKEIEKLGAIVVDWGQLVYDLINHNAEIENTEYEYNKNTFVITKSEKDGFHENMLAGYITTLMTYCAITGEKAEGQPFKFATDESINPEFSVDTFLDLYYTYGDTKTDFPKILKSEYDMMEIQKLVDKYLEEKTYRK